MSWVVKSESIKNCLSLTKSESNTCSISVPFNWISVALNVPSTSKSTAGVVVPTPMFLVPL